MVCWHASAAHAATQTPLSKTGRLAIYVKRIDDGHDHRIDRSVSSDVGLARRRPTREEHRVVQPRADGIPRDHVTTLRAQLYC